MALYCLSAGGKSPVNARIVPLPASSEEASKFLMPGVPDVFDDFTLDQSILAMEYLNRPPDDAIHKIADFFSGYKVLEIGAGCGVLAKILADLGTDIVATDPTPSTALAFPVELKTGVDSVRTYSDRNGLLACYLPTKGDDLFAKKFGVVIMPVSFQQILYEFSGDKLVLRTSYRKDREVAEAEGFKLVERSSNDLFFFTRR